MARADRATAGQLAAASAAEGTSAVVIAKTASSALAPSLRNSRSWSGVAVPLASADAKMVGVGGDTDDVPFGDQRSSRPPAKNRSPVPRHGRWAACWMCRRPLRFQRDVYRRKSVYPPIAARKL
jgi:hypothetical protein